MYRRRSIKKKKSKSIETKYIAGGIGGSIALLALLYLLNKQRSKEEPKEIIPELPYDVVEIKGDGSCMFRAIADQIDNDQNRHRQYRNMAVEYVENLPDEVKNNLGELVGNLDEYLQNMRKTSTWGDQIMLQALANVLGRQIIIVQRNTGNITEIVPRNFENNIELSITNLNPIVLLHYDEIHYDSLRDKPTSKPIPKLTNLPQDVMHNIQEYVGFTPVLALTSKKFDYLSRPNKPTDVFFGACASGDELYLNAVIRYISKHISKDDFNYLMFKGLDVVCMSKLSLNRKKMMDILIRHVRENGIRDSVLKDAIAIRIDNVCQSKLDDNTKRANINMLMIAGGLSILRTVNICRNNDFKLV